MLFLLLSFAQSLNFSPEISLNSVQTLIAVDTCKPITTSDSISQECFKETPESFILSYCPAKQICSFSLKNPSPTNCTDESSAESNSTHIPHLVAETYPCNSSLDCFPGLFCADVKINQTFIEKQCSERSMYECSHLDECIYGYVCNNSVCISDFYIEDGLPADTRVACKSGRIKDGNCLPSITTNSESLPKPCTTDEDCLASDNQTQGICSCLGPAGSFCELHESDKLNLDFLQATFESRLIESEHLYNRIVSYPVYEISYNWSDHYKGSKELYQIYQSSALLFSIITSYLIV